MGHKPCAADWISISCTSCLGMPAYRFDRAVFRCVCECTAKYNAFRARPLRTAFFPFFVGVYVTLYGMHVNEQLLCEFSI